MDDKHENQQRLFENALERAQRNVKEGLDRGVECPCCGQFCKLYKRKLNSGMAATLIWLVRAYETAPCGEWIHVQKVAPRYVIRSNEIGKLLHWGLVVQRPNDEDESKRTSGRWKPTLRGRNFVHRRESVPSHVHLYNNTVHGFSDVQIDIETALGDKFNYRELMEG